MNYIYSPIVLKSKLHKLKSFQIYQPLQNYTSYKKLSGMTFKTNTWEMICCQIYLEADGFTRVSQQNVPGSVEILTRSQRSGSKIDFAFFKKYNRLVWENIDAL